MSVHNYAYFFSKPVGNINYYPIYNYMCNTFKVHPSSTGSFVQELPANGYLMECGEEIYFGKDIKIKIEELIAERKNFYLSFGGKDFFFNCSYVIDYFNPHFCCSWSSNFEYEKKDKWDLYGLMKIFFQEINACYAFFVNEVADGFEKRIAFVDEVPLIDPYISWSNSYEDFLKVWVDTSKGGVSPEGLIYEDDKEKDIGDGIIEYIVDNSSYNKRQTIKVDKSTKAKEIILKCLPELKEKIENWGSIEGMEFEPFLNLTSESIDKFDKDILIKCFNCAEEILNTGTNFDKAYLVTFYLFNLKTNINAKENEKSKLLFPISLEEALEKEDYYRKYMTGEVSNLI